MSLLPFQALSPEVGHDPQYFELNPLFPKSELGRLGHSSTHLGIFIIGSRVMCLHALTRRYTRTIISHCLHVT